MKWHEIDENMKKSLKDYTPYRGDAEASKFKVWEAVQASQVKKKTFIWWKYAAIILLFIGLPTSFFFKYNQNGNKFTEIYNKKTIKTLNASNEINNSNNSFYTNDNKDFIEKDNFNTSVKVNKKTKIKTKLKTEILANNDTLNFNQIKTKDSILMNNSIEEQVLLTENTTNQSAERISIVELLEENNIDSKTKLIFNKPLNQIIAQDKPQKMKIRFGSKNKQVETIRLIDVIANL